MGAGHGGPPGGQEVACDGGLGKRPGMGAEVRDERKRCAECGKKYRPAPSALTHQRTCSKACRGRWRARQARERYAAELVASRRAARDRQRQSRGRRAAGPEPPRCGLSSAVEQAVDDEMDVLTAEWLECEVGKSLRRVAGRAVASAMSRAGLGGESPAVAGS